MDWNKIRKINRRASARKAQRETAAAQYAAAVEALGGDFSIDELRSADVRVIALPRQYVGITDPHVVWSIRGKDWLVAHDTGSEVFGMLLLEKRFDMENGRKVIVPGFKSAAAKKYAAERANKAHEDYEASQSVM